MTGARFILGSDIGGTFTDFVLLDTVAGTLRFAKVFSDPHHPEHAVLAGVGELDRAVPGFLAQTHPLVHGTTLAINALIERRGPVTGMIVTEGFRDVLEMRTGSRGDMWDLSGRLAEPLVPRWLRLEVPERVGATGEILAPVDKEAVAAAARQLGAEGATAVAICFLHGYAEDSNELLAAQSVREALPEAAICCSSEILPIPGEFARFSATVANAYLMPIASRYLPRLTDRLRAAGLGDDGLRVLASEGSQSAARVAAAVPIRFVESGPVGGVLAASWVGTQSGLRDVLSFDMGGTTAKTAVVEDGVLPLAEEYEVAREYRFAPGSGLPLNVPSVDVLEVGAGGGSIASISDLGFLQVGPDSAGAEPGPAAYGRGGGEPTLTDADVVLGLIDPAVFGGGDAGAEHAARAIRGRVAGPLGIGVGAAAQRMRELALATMATGIQTQLAARGTDTRGLTMIGYGGAGPLYAAELAAALGLRTVLVPPGAAVFSALGMVVSPAAYTALRPLRASESSGGEEHGLAQAYEDADREALAALRAADTGIAASDVRCGYGVDARYVGQGTPITVAVGTTPVTDPAVLRQVFDDEYERRFGYRHGTGMLEVVGVRVTAVHRDRRLDGLAALTAASPDAPDAPPEPRREVFAGTPHAATADVVPRSSVSTTATLRGPALVVDLGTTVHVPVGCSVRADDLGNLVITVEG